VGKGPQIAYGVQLHLVTVYIRGLQTFLVMGQKINNLGSAGQDDVVKTDICKIIKQHLHKFIYCQNTCIVEYNYVQSAFVVELVRSMNFV
jgi:hypothetical protein